MAEGLDLQLGVNLLANAPDLLQAQLPGQDHPACAQIKPALGAGVVGNGLLGGYMALAVGGVLPGQGKGPQVGDDQRIHSGIVQLFQIFGQPGDLVISGHGVHGHMDLDPMAVGKGHGLWQRLRGEVSREGPHAEAGSGQIYRVRAIQHGHIQLFHVPGGGQQFKLSHIILEWPPGMPRALPA